MKGVQSKEVNGKVRHFHFGTRMFELCEEQGVNVAELSDQIKGKVFGTVITVAHASAQAYCEMKGEEVDFNRVQVTGWLDEIGLQDFLDIMNEGLQSYQSKNEVALQK
jgi:hypothetical protein